MELDYPHGHHARTLQRIVPEFVEPVDDDAPTNAERQYQDSDVKSDIKEQFDDGDGDANTDDGYNEEGADNAIMR